ncbi:hypothetical protein FM996_04135 [Methylosinus sporium]|uniref:Uncharacterized protein n=1 Tax=Methylosinus sporium TaxID=428 RepID=A0A549T405_METSR|nr:MULTISPECIES: hypothetical protein [Methylosinus]MBU3889232.1 hypothetical protein [Methylosinus sp. KRF6]TRL36639.1 hypothetical protein FM996_04135 [Methylosinus sporium]
MADLLQELTSNLPSDPGSAFVIFAERVFSIFEAGRRIGSPDAVRIYLFYKTFASRFNLDIVIDDLDSVTDHNIKGISNNILGNRVKFVKGYVSSEINEMIDQISTNFDGSFGVARLNEQEKQKIRDHLEKIRRLIDESGLPVRKKNALFERLNALAQEVDQYGTRTDRFFAFMSDVAFVAGDMAKKSKPLIDEVKDMIKVVSRSRARQEGVSLPPGDEPILLPPPENISDEV